MTTGPSPAFSAAAARWTVMVVDFPEPTLLEIRDESAVVRSRTEGEAA